ncbi:MAG: GNAT family N-acetyltransferase [Bacteroidetes bacterium]|nr:GNAT family N-acetyltransferase [Bacteroidota bacterium]
MQSQATQIAGHGVLVYRRQPGNFQNPKGKVGYIMNMYTIPSFRRKGICTTILKALMMK